MATHASAAKRHRQSLKHRERNRNAKGTIRTTVKAAIESAKNGKKKEAEVLAKAATRLYDKAVVHGLLHRKTASRSISRLHKQLASIK